MTKKVLNIQFDCCHIECIRSDTKFKPYRVYSTDYRTRRQIASCSDFIEVLNFISDFYLYAMNIKPIDEVVEWSKKNGTY